MANVGIWDWVWLGAALSLAPWAAMGLANSWAQFVADLAACLCRRSEPSERGGGQSCESTARNVRQALGLLEAMREPKGGLSFAASARNNQAAHAGDKPPPAPMSNPITLHERVPLIAMGTTKITG